MLTLNTIVFSLTVILLLGVNSSNATISCTSCPMVIHFNLTSDADLNTDGCTLLESELCTLILRVDYTDINESFALIDGSKTPELILTNGEPQVSEITFIWFNELRVQRMANIICFSTSSCGLDLIKQIYKNEFRLFDYTTVQNRLADLLYTSSVPSSNLTCANPSGSSISCSDGFCRSIFDGNGFVTYSSCVKKGSVPAPYGLTVTKATMSDLGGDQASIIFTCNKPMCNSKENTQQVIQQLVDAQIIPQPVITTTAIIPTTPTGSGIQMMNNEQKLLVSFLVCFSILKIFN